MDSVAPLGSSRISEWLRTHVGYNLIHDSAELKASFRAATGFTPPEWEEESLAKGMERSLYVYPEPGVPRDQVITYGTAVAEAIEREFIPGRRPADQHYSGRGRNFDAILETLREVGL